jgi:uncharacterized protein YdeI (YjbR/CyaY-like superfamily)
MKKTSALELLHCKNIEQWRDWLQRHHNTREAVWLVFYRRESHQRSLDYESVLEEALCHGWIDSLIKKIDEFRYARKFTPRKKVSNWSEKNKERVAGLIEAGRMTGAGLAVVDAAKANGCWDKPDRPGWVTCMPELLQAALAKNRKALRAFEQLSSSGRREYITWIAIAKRTDTIEKRVKETVKMLTRGKKLGLR